MHVMWKYGCMRKRKDSKEEKKKIECVHVSGAKN